MKNLLRAIRRQRNKNEIQWGGIEHDILHTPNDWAAYILKQVFLATTGPDDHTIDGAWKKYLLKFRKHMITTAALAMDAADAITLCIEREEQKLREAKAESEGTVKQT